jgi:hypothetical protein
MTNQTFLDTLGLEAASSEGGFSYTFVRAKASFPHMPGGLMLSTILLVVFAGLPAAGAGLALYALGAPGGPLPWYQAALVGLFALQNAVRAALGITSVIVLGLFHALVRRFGRHELAFGPSEMHFGGRLGKARFGDRLSLGDVRQIIVYTYPESDEPGAAAEADLSIVLGNERATYGILRGFDGAAVESFARDISSRLGQLLSDLGIGRQPEAVAVVETASKVARALSHTLPRVPPRGWDRLARLVRRALFVPAANRALGLVWGGLLAAGTVALIPLLLRGGPSWGVGLLLLNALFGLTLVGVAWSDRPRQDSARGY